MLKLSRVLAPDSTVQQGAAKRCLEEKITPEGLTAWFVPWPPKTFSPLLLRVFRAVRVRRPETPVLSLHCVTGQKYCSSLGSGGTCGSPEELRCQRSDSTTKWFTFTYWELWVFFFFPYASRSSGAAASQTLFGQERRAHCFMGQQSISS